MEVRKPLVIALAVACLGAAPSRTQTYTAGQVISPTAVSENEDNIYSYLQAGVDTIRDGTIVNADVSGSAAITVGKLSLSNAITGAMLAIGSDAQGDILYYNGTDYTRLGAGTSGQFLMTQGASANPTWASATVSSRVQRTAGDLTTTSGTLADVTGASITLTTRANPVQVGWAASCDNSVLASDLDFNVDIDGTLQLGAVGLDMNEMVSGEPFNCSFVLQTAALSAGSHTIKLQWSTNGNTATIFCNSNTPCTFWAAEVND